MINNKVIRIIGIIALLCVLMDLVNSYCKLNKKQNNNVEKMGAVKNTPVQILPVVVRGQTEQT